MNLGPKGKMWMALIGTAITQLATVNAAIQTAATDDAFDTGEITSIGTALLTAGLTVYGVYKIRNQKSNN